MGKKVLWLLGLLVMVGPLSADAFPLPTYDEAYIEQFEKNPAAYENDKEALIRFSEQYSLRIFSRIVQEYMQKMQLSEAPISPQVFDSLFSYMRRQPRAALWEMVRFGNGLNAVIGTVQYELGRYEVLSGKVLSMVPPPTFVFDSPGSTPKEIIERTGSLQQELTKSQRINYALFGLLFLGLIVLFLRGRRA